MKKPLAIILATAAALTAAAAKPSAVSLDYCADQYLLTLADDDQILAVSRGSDKHYSYMRESAQPFRKIRASSEEALVLEPDVIFRQWGGGGNAQSAFGRFGAKVVSLGYPNDFDGVIENIRLVAGALEQETRGEELVGELEEKLAALKTSGATGARALYVTPGGVTAGKGTMINAMMETAGVVNITADEGKAFWPSLPAEALLLDPPQFIVAGFFRSEDEDINFWSAARHPAIAKQLRDTPTIHLDADLLSCAAPHSIEASVMIAREAGALSDDR